MLAAFAIFTALAVAFVAVLLRLRRGRALLLRRAPFDDLVELAAVEPYAAACRAVVDFDILALGHHEVD